MSTENLHRKNHDDWATPSWIKDGLFRGWFDPCPLKGAGGLEIEWPDQTFVNPPYSNVRPWVEKAIKENIDGKTVALLLKHDHTPWWFWMLTLYGAHILLDLNREVFSGEGVAAFASTIFVLYGGKKTEGCD